MLWAVSCRGSCSVPRGVGRLCLPRPAPGLPVQEGAWAAPGTAGEQLPHLGCDIILVWIYFF